MAASLEDEVRAREMLGSFTAKVAEPQSAVLLPPGPLDGPLDEANRARLRQDLDLLAGCHSLPAGFPLGARVLIVEAGSDRIVEPQARTMLRAALPAAEVRTLPGIGHALLSDGVMANVIDWVESWRDAED
jgi:pimeloyl-[acyl-carrier protein] methyl ester esterase